MRDSSLQRTGRDSLARPGAGASSVTDAGSPGKRTLVQGLDAQEASGGGAGRCPTPSSS